MSKRKDINQKTANEMLSQWQELSEEKKLESLAKEGTTIKANFIVSDSFNEPYQEGSVLGTIEKKDGSWYVVPETDVKIKVRIYADNINHVDIIEHNPVITLNQKIQGNVYWE